MIRLWLLLCLASLSACSRTDSGLVFTYGHSQSASAPRSQSMDYFKSELERRSEGRLKVKLYYSGTLGTEREMMDMVAMGAIQGTRGGLFADANPAYVLLMLPFLVEDWDQALRLVDSSLARELNAAAARKGFYVPAMGLSQGFRAHTNSVRPITRPEDLKGLKMRVPPQEVFVLTASAFGSSPQEMPATDIYQALRTGVLDGQDNPPANIWDYKLHEVQRYLSVSNYATGPDPLMVSLQWYRALPDDLQPLFDAVARETMLLSDQLNRKSEQRYLQDLRQSMAINVITSQELARFRELVKPVYQHFVDRGDLSWADILRARAIAQGEQD